MKSVSFMGNFVHFFGLLFDIAVLLLFKRAAWKTICTYLKCVRIVLTLNIQFLPLVFTADITIISLRLNVFYLAFIVLRDNMVVSTVYWQMV
jgi:hypothetical protein